MKALFAGMIVGGISMWSFLLYDFEKPVWDDEMVNTPIPTERARFTGSDHHPMTYAQIEIRPNSGTSTIKVTCNGVEILEAGVWTKTLWDWQSTNN